MLFRASGSRGKAGKPFVCICMCCMCIAGEQTGIVDLEGILASV